MWQKQKVKLIFSTLIPQNYIMMFKTVRFQSFFNHQYVHTDDYVTDYASCPIYLDRVWFSAWCLVSSVLVAAGSNRRFWLLHALLVNVIVTIITFLISETVALIVIVIACLVGKCVPFLVLPWLPVISDNI